MKTTRIFILGLRAEPWSVSIGEGRRVFKGAKLKQYQKDLRLIAGAKVRAIDFGMQPVRMDLLVIRKRSKTAAKARAKDGIKGGFEWHTQTPDRDNFHKATQDAFKGFWPDDSIVCSGTTDKMFGPEDAICIIFSEPESVDEVLSFYGISEGMF